MSGSSNTYDGHGFLVDVGELKIPGHFQFFRSGVNPSVGADDEDLWGVGGIQIFPSTPALASIVSTSSADTSAGTGSRVVRVYGLDATYTRLVNDVTLNGTSAVTTSAAFFRVTRIESISVGSSGHNEGSITLSIGGNPQAFIKQNENMSHDLNYTVPAKYWLFLTHFTITAETGRDVLVKVLVSNPGINGGVTRTITTSIVSASGISTDPIPMVALPPFSDISIKVTKLSGAAGQASGILIGYLTSDSDVNTGGIDGTEGF